MNINKSSNTHPQSDGSLPLGRSFHGFSSFSDGDDLIEYTDLPKQYASAELKLRDHFAAISANRAARAAPANEFASTLNSESFLPVDHRPGVDYYVPLFIRGIIPGLLIIFMSAIPFACITGIWTEIPLIYNQLPEKNAVSSQIGLAYNIGNVFPFLYVALRRFMPPEKYSFAVLTFLSAVPGILLGFYWHMTADVFGAPHSVMLIAMSFVAGGLGTTISVILYSYIARYQRWVTTAAAVGMGLCSVLIAALGTVQNVPGSSPPSCLNPDGTPSRPPPPTAQPAFPVEYFFFILAAIHLLGFIAFLVIECSPLMNAYLNPLEFLEEIDRLREQANHSQQAQRLVNKAAVNHASEDDDVGSIPAIVVSNNRKKESIYNNSSDILRFAAANRQSINTWSLMRAGFSPVVNQGVKALMVYFVNPGLMTYLTNDAKLISYLILTAQVSNMLGRLATGFVSFQYITLLNVVCTAFFAYEVFIAVSHFPPPAPEWILIPVTGVYAFLNGYVSTEVYMVADANAVREFGDSAAMEPARIIRRYVTLVNQLGSVAGSLLCAAAATTGYLHPKLAPCAITTTTTTIMTMLTTTTLASTTTTSAMTTTTKH